MELNEAINHAKTIKSLDCKICGLPITNLVEMVNAIRHDGYCKDCSYKVRHGERFVTIEGLLS